MKYWVDRWNTEDENVALKTKQRSGRPSKITQENGQEILNLVTNNPIITSTNIVERLGIACRPRTIRNFLHKNNIHARQPARKVELFPHHANQRLNFANTNLNRDWGTVIFTDEKVFSTSEESKKMVWRQNGTRFEERHVVPVRRSSRISIAYWGWLSAAGPGELTQIHNKMNAEQYIQVLEDVLIPSVRALYPEPTPIFLVQDNSAVHTSRMVRQWFENYPEINLLGWPPKSPDINPIENVWGIMCDMWEKRGVPLPRTREALDRHVKEIWESLRGTDICATTVQSMNRRLEEIIQRNGYWTHY